MVPNVFTKLCHMVLKEVVKPLNVSYIFFYKYSLNILGL